MNHTTRTAVINENHEIISWSEDLANDEISFLPLKKHYVDASFDGYD